LGGAIDKYRADVGKYPLNLQALRYDPGAPNWLGPYFPGDIPLDPWGHAYIYSRHAIGKPEVISLGAEGEPGGTGVASDVSNWEPTGGATRRLWIRVLRFSVITVSALGFFGYPFFPAFLVKLNARLDR
jgi:hypothetical protein